MRTIFVDMDGVLSDFEKRFEEKFGLTPQQVREDRKVKRFSKFWHKFIDDEEFAKLDTFPGADKLIFELTALKEKFKLNIAILTSSGGFDRHLDVTNQKIEWLHSQCIDWAPIVVPGKRFKAAFANHNSFLIDDTVTNVGSFVNAGGTAFLHKKTNETIAALEVWLDNKVIYELHSEEENEHY